MCGIFVCFGVWLFVVARIWSFVVFWLCVVLYNYTIFVIWCNLSKLFVVGMCKYVVMRLLCCCLQGMVAESASLVKVKLLAVKFLVILRVPENCRQPFKRERNGERGKGVKEKGCVKKKVQERGREIKREKVCYFYFGCMMVVWIDILIKKEIDNSGGMCDRVRACACMRA